MTPRFITTVIGDQLQAHSSIPVCMDPDDATTFAVEDGGRTGDSTNLWLRGIGGGPVGGIALVALAVILANHQWRFYDGDDEATKIGGAGNGSVLRRRTRRAGGCLE